MDETQTLEKCIQICREMIDKGASQAAILEYLHGPGTYATRMGPNPLQAIIVVRSLYDLDLKTALDLICADPSWTEEARHILS